MSHTNGQKANTHVQWASVILVFAIGVFTVAVSIWSTSRNLEMQTRIFAETTQSHNEAMRLSFSENREREEINLRREKLELLTEMMGQLYGTYGNYIPKEMFRYAVNALSAKGAPRDILENTTADLYSLKLRVNGLTTLYFPELTAPFNNSFDEILKDINSFLRGDRQISPVRVDVFSYISDERKEEHLRNYNKLLDLIRVEAEKLNILSQKYNPA